MAELIRFNIDFPALFVDSRSRTSGGTLIMDDTTQDVPVAANQSSNKPEWSKPEMTAFAPVQAAEGISYRPNDGLSNLS